MKYNNSISLKSKIYIGKIKNSIKSKNNNAITLLVTKRYVDKNQNWTS